MKDPQVSVVIPACNAERYIEECLLSLKKQTFKDFEVIVVDDASSDQTSQIAQKYARVIRNEKNLGEGSSRNVGSNAARGEILAHTDSDVVLPPAWLERIVHNLKQKGIKAVTGGYCDSIGDSFIERFSHLELVFRRKDLTGFVNTAVFNNFACYRDIFFECGGFTEKKMAKYKCEDLRLSFKISKSYPIYWDKESCVFHHFRSSPLKYLKEQYYFGRDTVWSYYCHPGMIFKRTHQGRAIYLETILMFLAIAGLFIYPVAFLVFLLLLLLLNYKFLKFLKKEGLPSLASVLLILTRDIVCVFSVFAGIALVFKEIIKKK